MADIGKIIGSDAERDAIHIAVLPAVAGEPLRAGDKVDFSDGIASLSRTGGVGIVDPFLNGVVLAGERFYIFLHPNSVTSMVHKWTCPAIDSASATEERMSHNAILERYARQFRLPVRDLVTQFIDFAEGSNPICLDFDTPDYGDDLVKAVEWCTGQKIADKLNDRLSKDYKRPFRCSC